MNFVCCLLVIALHMLYLIYVAICFNDRNIDNQIIKDYLKIN